MRLLRRLREAWQNGQRETSPIGDDGGRGSDAAADGDGGDYDDDAAAMPAMIAEERSRPMRSPPSASWMTTSGGESSNSPSHQLIVPGGRPSRETRYLGIIVKKR